MRQSFRMAVAIGDAAGISPELAARVLGPGGVDQGDMIVIGDSRVLQMGARHCGLDIDLPVVDSDVVAGGALPDGSFLIDLGNCDPAAVPLGAASVEGGRASLQNFRVALLTAQAGLADAVFFTPFNKHAMRLARADYIDEIGFVDETLRAERSGREFNVLDEVWNARVTSHVPLRKVADALTEDSVFESLRLTVEVMEHAGVERPRIGVAALNPHAGDGRNFGTEDEDVLLPAVLRAQSHQMAVTGPIPADTVFVRAVKGEFDAVLTMYHDQGQIAMKLLGFDRGVTLIAGYPFPIVTPAHGTAYDIAGKGLADTGATFNAVALGRTLAGRKQPVTPDPKRYRELARFLRAVTEDIKEPA